MHERASGLTKKVGQREAVFSQNTRPAVRLSLREQEPRVPSKTLFTEGRRSRQGEEEAERRKVKLSDTFL